MNSFKYIRYTESVLSKTCGRSWQTYRYSYGSSPIFRCFSKRTDDDSLQTDINQVRGTVLNSMSSLEKYDTFRDEDSPIILDVQEERLKFLQEEQHINEFSDVPLQRGVEGVFDIEDLVSLLQREKAEDIFVVRVPPEIRYVNYIVVVSGKSPRHMTAMGEFVRKVYKRKRHSTDLIPKIEGEGSRDWIALDLGNIALHIFSQRVRKVYDLESLWSIGAEYDEKVNQADDPVIELLLKHSVYLGDLEPANTNT